MQNFEKVGVFCLGRIFDAQTGKGTDDLVLYDSRDLTTHAVCVGMIGSGKTGLCIALLEEAARDGPPSLVVDPPGDPAGGVFRARGPGPGAARGICVLPLPPVCRKGLLPWWMKNGPRRKGL